MRRFPILAVIAFSLASAPAQAQQVAWTACRDASSPSDKISACSRAVQVLPKGNLLERAWLRLGNGYSEAGMFPQAITAYSRLITLRPTVAGYYDNRHAAYKSLGNYQAALSDVSEAIRLQPNMAFGYRSRGLLLDAMAQPDAAIRDLDTGIRIDPSDGGLRVERGKVFERLGKLDAAIQDYTEALSVDPKAIYALKERARALGKVGNRQAALSDIAAYLRLQPGDAEGSQIQASLEEQPPATMAAPAEPKKPPHEKSEIRTGSAFFVNDKGYLVTNAHVVRDCSLTQVASQDEIRKADIVGTDEHNDLALLKTSYQPSRAVHIRQGLKLGEQVAVFGFPLTGILSTRGNFTLGNVSSLSGIGDDSKLMQLTAPVQPGNSGGPVLDSSANVVGVVVSKLDAMKLAAVNEDIAQNVNFAIKANVLTAFLESNGISYQGPETQEVLEPTQLAAAAKEFSAMIVCRP